MDTLPLGRAGIIAHCLGSAAGPEAPPYLEFVGKQTARSTMDALRFGVRRLDGALFDFGRGDD